MDKINNDIKGLRSLIWQMDRTINSLSIQIYDEIEKLGTENKKSHELENSLEDLNRANSALTSDNDALETENLFLKEQILELEDKMEELKDKIEELKDN